MTKLFCITEKAEKLGVKTISNKQMLNFIKQGKFS